MIYTVTFNPAIDYVVRLEAPLEVGEVNRAAGEDCVLGGKVTFTAFMPSAKRRAAGFNGRWRAAIPSASATPSEPDGIPADRGKPSTMGSTFQPNGEPRCWRLRTAP